MFHSDPAFIEGYQISREEYIQATKRKSKAKIHTYSCIRCNPPRNTGTMNYEKEEECTSVQAKRVKTSFLGVFFFFSFLLDKSFLKREDWISQSGS